jgi:hypothetical protein
MARDIRPMVGNLISRSRSMQRSSTRSAAMLSDPAPCTASRDSPDRWSQAAGLSGDVAGLVSGGLRVAAAAGSAFPLRIDGAPNMAERLSRVQITRPVKQMSDNLHTLKLA